MIAQLKEIKFTTTVEYIESLRKITTALVTSYIYNNIIANEVEKLTTMALVDTIKQNLPNCEARLAVTVGNYQSCSDVYNCLMQHGGSIPLSSINAVNVRQNKDYDLRLLVESGSDVSLIRNITHRTLFVFVCRS